MKINIFEYASKHKLRFAVNQGMLVTAEDLWDLPLTATGNKASLDKTAKAIHKQMRDESDISFVTPSSVGSAALTAKLDILKHIIEIKMKNAKAKENAAVKATRNDHIRKILLDKQLKGLEDKTVAELQAELEKD